MNIEKKLTKIGNSVGGIIISKEIRNSIGLKDKYIMTVLEDKIIIKPINKSE